MSAASAQGKGARKAQPAAAPLLVELLVEELPPKLLCSLAEQFAQALLTGLQAAGYAGQGANVEPYATPRRLAAAIDSCMPTVAARTQTVRGPAAAACYGSDGKPTRALLGFAAAHGMDPKKLKRIVHGGREHMAAVKAIPATKLSSSLAAIIEDALDAVSAPRMMRWGSGERRFVRPLRGLLAIHGSTALKIAVAGIAASKGTPGHRARCGKTLPVPAAAKYAATLKRDHKVVASVSERSALIERQLAAAAGSKLKAAADPELVAENAAMCEYPQVYAAQFDRRFLALPPEAVVSCLKQHMRCFVLRSRGKLANRFLLVADNKPARPQPIVAGFERVVAARLADAEFYWLADRREVSEPGYRAKLAALTYHAKLGSVADRIGRLAALAGQLQGMDVGIAGPDLEFAARAAAICKLDLATRMIGEHPELEGIMAAHYFAAGDARLHALVAGHLDAVLDRKAADPARWALVFVVEFERLAGLLMAGERLAGDRDPHGMRKSAARLAALLASRQQLELRALIKPLLAVMRKCLNPSEEPDPQAIEEDCGRIVELLLDRARSQPRAVLGLARVPPTAVLNAVIDPQAEQIMIGQLAARIGSVAKFIASAEGKALVEAHKRVANILRKSETAGVEPAALAEADELALDAAMRRAGGLIERATAGGDFAGALAQLASLAAPVGKFFDHVLVNCEDPQLRAARHALMGRLRVLLNSVAKLERLTA